MFKFKKKKKTNDRDFVLLFSIRVQIVIGCRGTL